MNLVSILIAAYNAERWVAEAIESALGQTHPQVEVVVVDDGSTDGTLAVARSFEERGVRVVHQTNAGACAARNRALEEAQGEFVKFLDADDALTLDAVAAQLNALALHRADRHIVPYGDAVATDEELRPLASASSMAPPPQQVFSPDLGERIAALLSHNIATPLPLHRRELLEQVGGFRSHLRRGQEYDLHLRLALHGVRFLHVPHVGTYVREHFSPSRITNTSPLLSDPSDFLAVQVERRQMIEDHLGTPLPSPIIEVLAHSIWSHMRRLVQANEREVVNDFLMEALRLDPNIQHTGTAFSVLGKLCDPIRAERILMTMRRLLGRS